MAKEFQTNGQKVKVPAKCLGNFRPANPFCWNYDQLSGHSSEIFWHLAGILWPRNCSQMVKEFQRNGLKLKLWLEFPCHLTIV